MAILKRRSRMISFRLSEDEYASLRSACEDGEARSVSDLARDAVHRLVVKDLQIDVESTLRELKGRLDNLDLQVQTLLAAGQSRRSCPRRGIPMARPRIELAVLAFGWVLTVNAQTAALINTGPATGAASRLGPGDVIQIHAVDEEGMSDKPIRIGSDGYIDLPTVGRLKVRLTARRRREVRSGHRKSSEAPDRQSGRLRGSG